MLRNFFSLVYPLSEVNRSTPAYMNMNQKNLMIIDFAEKLLNSGHRATVDDAGVWTDNLNLKSVYFSKSKKDFESTAFVPVAIKIPYYNYQDFVKNADLPQIRKSEEILEKFALIKDNLIKKNHHGLYHETKKDINRSLFGTTDFNDKQAKLLKEHVIGIHPESDDRINGSIEKMFAVCEKEQQLDAVAVLVGQITPFKSLAIPDIMGATDDELAAVDPSDWRMYAVIFYKDLGRSKYTNGALFELKQSTMKDNNPKSKTFNDDKTYTFFQRVDIYTTWMQANGDPAEHDPTLKAINCQAPVCPLTADPFDLMLLHLNTMGTARSEQMMLAFEESCQLAMVNGAFDKIYEKEPDAILNMAVTHRFEYAYKRQQEVAKYRNSNTNVSQITLADFQTGKADQFVNGFQKKNIRLSSSFTDKLVKACDPNLGHLLEPAYKRQKIDEEVKDKKVQEDQLDNDLDQVAISSNNEVDDEGSIEMMESPEVQETVPQDQTDNDEEEDEKQKQNYESEVERKVQNSNGQKHEAKLNVYSKYSKVWELFMQHAALAEEKCHGPLWSKYLKGVVTEKEAEKCVELYHLMKEKYIPDWEAAMAKRNKNIMIPKKNGIKTSPKDKNQHQLEEYATTEKKNKNR